MLRMDVGSPSGFRGLDHLNDNRNETLLHGCLDEADNEADADGSSGLAARLKGLNLGQGLFICVDKLPTIPNGASSEEDEELGVALSQLFDQEIYTPVKLKSAMKGSREKQGLLPKKLSVTWAPDVYDPPPTSALHTVRGRKQRKSRKNNEKKNGKKGHKGSNNSPRSGGGKKHFFRGGGSSDRSYRPLDAAVVFPDDSLDGFHVGNPDAFCGSSFLKQSPTKLHFPVAEAL